MSSAAQVLENRFGKLESGNILPKTPHRIGGSNWSFLQKNKAD